MLVDSHCHLDFPDLVADVDGVIARHGGRHRPHRHHLDPGGATTRCSASPSAFPGVLLGRTHPHHAHEELDVTADDLVERSRHPKVGGDRRSRPRLSLRFQPQAAQEQGFRAHIAAARATGLPLVIHSREADDDTARILDGGDGAGPSRPCSIAYRRPRAGPGRHRARPLRLLHRHPDLQGLE